MTRRATKAKFLRALVQELSVAGAEIRILPTDHLEGEDLLATTTINRHTSAAHAAICMAAEEAANFLQSVRDQEIREQQAARLEAQQAPGRGTPSGGAEVAPRCVDCRVRSDGRFASRGSERWPGECIGCGLQTNSLATTVHLDRIDKGNLVRDAESGQLREDDWTEGQTPS